VLDRNGLGDGAVELLVSQRQVWRRAVVGNHHAVEAESDFEDVLVQRLVNRNPELRAQRASSRRRLADMRIG